VDRLPRAGACAAVFAAAAAFAGGSSGAAATSADAGAPFLTQALALARGDFALACAQFSKGLLRERVAGRPSLDAARRACVASLAEEQIDKPRYASTRIVNVRVKPARARVTVQTTFHDLEPRATGTAVFEDGAWKIREPPGNAHVGSLFLYRIPSSSMIPALRIGDTALIDHDAYDRARPAIGDIVVFKPPLGAEQEKECAKRPPKGQACAVADRRTADVNFIKRIVARPGDRISIRGGRVVRNGRLAREPFAMPCHDAVAGCDLPRTFTVSGGYYLLGDDRGASDDSRSWGPVAKTALIGRLVRVIPAATRA